MLNPFKPIGSAMGSVFGNKSKFNPMNAPGLKQVGNTLGMGQQQKPPTGIGPSTNMGRTQPAMQKMPGFGGGMNMGQKPPWMMKSPQEMQGGDPRMQATDQGGWGGATNMPMQRGPDSMNQPDNGQRMDPYEIYKQNYGRGIVAPTTPMASKDQYMNDYNNLQQGQAPEAMQPSPQFGQQGGGMGPSPQAIQEMMGRMGQFGGGMYDGSRGPTGLGGQTFQNGRWGGPV